MPRQVTDLMYIMQAINDTRVFVTTAKSLDEAMARVNAKHPDVTIHPRQCIAMHPNQLIVVQTGAPEDVGVHQFPGNRDHSKPAVVPSMGAAGGQGASPSKIREDPAYSARSYVPLPLADPKQYCASCGSSRPLNDPPCQCQNDE